MQTTELTLDQTRRFKTIPRNAPRYSHDGLGHWESPVKEAEKQILVLIFHTLGADHSGDSDRRATGAVTQCTVRAEEHMSFFKLMSKNYHGEAVKFAELSWFCSIAKQSKLAEQWNDAHLVGKLKRDDEHLLVIRGLTRSARAGRRQAPSRKGGIWAASKQRGVVLWELKASTTNDTSVARQKYITNEASDEHRRAPICTRCAWDIRAQCRTRFVIILTRHTTSLCRCAC